jgi:hypothetical protein
MSSRPWIVVLAALALAGCSLPQRVRPAPVDSGPVSAASLGRVCSDLRSDIGSARYRQRNLPSGSNNAVIAEAAEAREDQRIEALRQRYESLGCALVAPAETPGTER